MKMQRSKNWTPYGKLTWECIRTDGGLTREMTGE